MVAVVVVAMVAVAVTAVVVVVLGCGEHDDGETILVEA